jgi:methyl-accepting chemotaxis protein
MDLIREIQELAEKTYTLDESFSLRLKQLADVLINKPEHASVDLYGSFSLDSLEEKAFSDHQVRPRFLVKWLGFLEWVRNILVLIPIAITWHALWQASLNYNTLIAQEPELIEQPFLLLWEQGFRQLENVAGMTFSQVAFFDFSLLFIVILLTVVIHFYRDTRELGARKNAADLRCRVENVLWQANLQLAETRHKQTPSTAVFQFQDIANQLIHQLEQERDRLNQLVADQKQDTNDIITMAQQLGGTTNDLRQFSQDIQKTYTPLNGSVQRLITHMAAVDTQQGELVTTLGRLNGQMDSLITDIRDTTTELTESVIRISDYTGLSVGVFRDMQKSMHDMVHRTEIVVNNLRDATGNMRDSSQELHKILSTVGALEDNLVSPLQTFTNEMNKFAGQVPGITEQLEKSGQFLQSASVSLVNSVHQITNVTQTSARNLQITESLLNDTTRKLQGIISDLQDATKNAAGFSQNMNNTIGMIGQSMQELGPTLQGLTKLIRSGGTLRFGKIERVLIALVLLMLFGSCVSLAILAVTNLGFNIP